MRGRYNIPLNKEFKHYFSSWAARAEYGALQSTSLVVDNYVRESLLIQSALGRIRSGHGSFSPAFSEATFEDLCDFLDISSYKIKQRRQELIYGYKRGLDKLLEGDTNCLLDKNGFPIFGINFLKRYQITDIEAALKGAVLLGLHDSKEWRQRTMEHYNTTLNGKIKIELGYGHEFLISPIELYRNGYSLENLEKKRHREWEIEQLREKGVIVEDPVEGVTNQYIRLREGLGTCDDAIILTVGRIYGQDALVMGFLMDATDTYEKHMNNPVEGGIDEQYARHVQEKWREKHGKELLTPEEIMRVIYLGAKSNSPFIPFSSSHRRFVERPQKKKKRPSEDNPMELRSFLLEEAQKGPEFSFQSTIENHMKFLKHGFKFPCKLGFERFDSIKFYNAIKRRWEVYEERFGVKLEDC